MLFELSALLGISYQLQRVPILNRLKDPKIIDQFNSKIRTDFPDFSEKFEEKEIMVSDKDKLSVIRNQKIFRFPTHFL